MRCRWRTGRAATSISLLIVREAWPERNGPRPPRRSSRSSMPQHSVTVSGSLSSNQITGTSRRSPWNEMTLLRDPNFQSLARLGTGRWHRIAAGAAACPGRSSNDSQRNAAAISFLSPTARSGNEEAVLQAVSGHALPVHCFGIDHAVNEAFLRQLSGQQRGTSVFLTPDDDLVRPIAILGSRLSRPVFTDLTLDGGWELADTELPDIHAGQVVFASVRARGEVIETSMLPVKTLSGDR